MEKQKNIFLSFTSQKIIEDAVFVAHYHKDSFHAGYPLHKHDYFELLYFISGDVDYEVSRRIYRMQKNDVLMIHPQQLHQPHFLKSNEDYERIILWISKAYLQDLCRMKPAIEDCIYKSHPESEPCLIRPQVSLQTQIGQMFFDLAKASIYEKSDEFCKVKIENLIRFLSTLPKPHDFQKREESPDHQVIESILRYLDEHFCEDISLDLIANRFFINKFHFVHQFTERVGLSPYRYILQKRLNQARELLARGHKSKEVAYSCGFKDYSNFYRAFRSTFEESPSDYVKKIKADS